MAAAFILAVLAIVFFAAAAVRYMRRGGAKDPATRTWLLIAAIFTTVAAWLQWHTS
ncbi:hypothetical protein ABL849_03500 [Variovorax sp. 375MFSha3.1]|uniref:Uncharacterized membrane protein HdeD (DUF308 family) n=1 Tax=Variovorax guangxiensis TaxID=1775474 RepID=A0A840FRL1_9BURK|nr:hypothetical protein [Variovorax guangxiensis]MBB4222964.1 uncharacterized membrane protein HdeD (DUF308 family) [Variovorax guangxiensis]